MSRRETAILLSLFGLFLAPGKAQVTAVAQVSGTIADPSGAAIANANVTMTEVDKQATHSTKSDSAGNYTLPNLPVGPYRLEVRAPGFKDYIQNGLDLVANNNIQVNVGMQVGSATERIEVSATASMVETKENSVSALVDQQRINELPLNGRQVTDLIYTVGAAVPADSGDLEARASGMRRVSPWPADKATARPIFWTAATRPIPCRTPICRSRSRTHCRSSALRPARCPRNSARTRARR